MRPFDSGFRINHPAKAAKECVIYVYAYHSMVFALDSLTTKDVLVPWDAPCFRGIGIAF